MRGFPGEVHDQLGRQGSESSSVNVRLPKLPDTYVYDKLEILYRKLGNESRAQHYAALKLAAVN